MRMASGIRRKMVLPLFMSLLLCFPVQASDHSHALKLHAGTQNLAQKTDSKTIPGYQTNAPPETQLAHIDRLQEASSQAVTSNPHTQWLKNSTENRPYFRLNPSKDPLFENTQEMVENSKEFLKKGHYTSTRSKGTVLKKCQESRPDTVYTCSQTLLEPTIHIEPAKYSHYWCRMGNHRPDDSRCRAKKYYNPARKYQDEVVTVTREKWTTNCQALEERTKKGLCRLIQKTCPRGPETRDVVASVGGDGKPVIRAIRRNCWYYELEYQCYSASSPNNCEPLRQAPCSQISSRCLKTLGGTCVNWEQTFKCPQKSFPETQSHHFKPLHLEEPGKSPSSPHNKELGTAITQLEVLNQAQGEIRSAGGKVLPRIFKGQCNRCTIAFAGFKNCCAGEKGWGVGMNIAGCDGQDRQTNQKVSQRKCVKIGTYCAEKTLLGICLRKKRTYCCFDSKLARLLHEQGRSFGWGDAEHPNCRGFTVQELSQINFDGINFGDAFDDALKSMTLPQSQAVNRNLSHRLTQMTSSLKNKSKRGAY